MTRLTPAQQRDRLTQLGIRDGYAYEVSDAGEVREMGKREDDEVERDRERLRRFEVAVN